MTETQMIDYIERFINLFKHNLEVISLALVESLAELILKLRIPLHGQKHV